MARRLCSAAVMCTLWLWLPGGCSGPETTATGPLTFGDDDDDDDDSVIVDDTGTDPTSDAREALLVTLGDWPAFPDTHNALKQLQGHFALAIVSNIDDNLFKYSQEVLDIEFDHIITAQSVGAYKPDKAVFEQTLAQVEGPVLHVAQSRFHDILPASDLGLDTVWINRPSRGAAKAAEAEPTWTFTSMAEFAAAITE